MIAIGYGADVLEKHITWSRSVKGIDYESSLDPEGFNHFVNLVRIADQSVGIPYSRPLTDEEKVYRKRMKRVVCSSQIVKKGKVLTDDMLVFLRAEGEYLPDAIGSILGRRATRDLPAFIPLKVGDVL